jgi:hypothetical protein
MARKKGSKNKVQSGPTERLAGDLPSELAREFKAACARNGETITYALVTLASVYVQYRGHGGISGDSWKDGEK